jgi:hypothetical protein
MAVSEVTTWAEHDRDHDKKCGGVHHDAILFGSRIAAVRKPD